MIGMAFTVRDCYDVHVQLIMIVYLICRLLDWRERKNPDGPTRKKSDKIVIFKHLFDPKEFEVSFNVM